MKRKQQEQDQNTENKLFREALLRRPEYSHPLLQIKHHPINMRQCMELQQQLHVTTRIKVDEVQNHYDLDDLRDQYQKQYSQFCVNYSRDEMDQKQMGQSIKQMHDLSQMLINPPSFSMSLHLFSKTPPTYEERVQLDRIQNKYRIAHQMNEGVNEGDDADEIIRSAKKYLLRNYFQK